MAAPPEKTIRDLSGEWIMNKTLSGDFDAILALQGLGWLRRKAIAFATVTLTITQGEGPPPWLDISSIATGGIHTTEKRVLTWEERPHEDSVFGAVMARSRLTGAEGLEVGAGLEDKEFLTQGWEEGTTEWLQSWAKSVDGGWVANQIWGFEIVDGVRYYVRHVVVRKGDEMKQAKLIYDYQTPSS